MKEDECDVAFPCPCYRRTKCQLAGFEKIVELKNAGLTIYRHSSQFDDKIKLARREDEENVFIFHNTKDADIQSVDFLPEMEKRAIKCSRCRRIMDHALNILQKVTAICKNEVIGICDHCKLKQRPCCDCVGAIKKFYDVKKEAQQIVLSKKTPGELLSKVQDEFKGYFGDGKRGRTEILKDHPEDDTNQKLRKKRAKSDEHIDQLCRWKYVRGGRDLNIKDLYRKSDRSGLIKPTVDTDKAKKHIAFKEDKQIIYEPSTSMFSIERQAKSTISTMDEKEMLTSQDGETDEKKSGLLPPEKVGQYDLDTVKQLKIYDDTRADKSNTESEQKELNESDILKEKDYFKIVETKSGNINKDFVFSFPRDEKETHEVKRQKSSTELIHDVHDKMREKTEEKKRIQEEMRRKKIETEEKKLAARAAFRKEKDVESKGKTKESKSAPEIRDTKKDTVLEPKLKSKSAISKESRPEEARVEGKDTKDLKTSHKQPKTEAEAETKHPKGESKQPKDDSKTVSKQVEGASKQAKEDLKQPKVEPKPPKLEPKKDSKEPKTESKRGPKHLIAESKQQKVEPKGTTTEPKLDSTQTKPPKPPKVEEKVVVKQTKGESKETKYEPKGESKQMKGEPKQPKKTGDLKEPTINTKGLKSDKEAKVDRKDAKKSKEQESKSEPKVPKADTKEPKPTTKTTQLEIKEQKDAKTEKIEKELSEKEKPPPPKIEEEPMIKYGKDIKLRSPDEPRVPRRQIEAPPPPPPKKKPKRDLKVKQISMLKPSQNLLALQMVQVKSGETKERTLSQLMTQSEIFTHMDNHKTLKGERCPMCIDSQLELEYESRQRQKAEMQEIIDGRNIKHVAGFDKSKDKDAVKPLFYQLKYNDQFKAEFIQAANETPGKVRHFDTTQKPAKTMPEDGSKGVIKYALSDRSFIEKGWTKLPTEKVVRKMNVYRMRPAHPEFDWFQRNKSKRLMTYDTGERLAEFDDDGRGRWYYKNQRLALQYYDAEELNAQQRFVIFSNGEPDERGRARPYTVLATFDYLGNGVVFDHGGKIRLKYNQTEGVVLDRSIGPASHWKWHTLNDPPVLQQVMIDTQMTHKDPEILKMGAPNENLPRPDNEDMLAIEFDNFIKEKSQKLKQTFKPFQIKMKAMKINEHFSLKVLDQANVYLIYRDGTTNIKLNLGMILDHKEIVDTDTAEVGEVSNNIERFPAKTDSLAAMQKSVAYAKHFERSRTERERRLRPPEPSASADKLTAAASKPLKPPLCAAYSSTSCTTINSKPLPKPKSRKPSSSNVYYDSRLL